ncbi:MAG: peptide-methionine (S)-S-oxide reductase MsrA [Armatimonadetes bacterium]|nr:peptide-methionine (S)-S-oxide reductase MsrA [Armatimonadota bacterium]MDE2205998.1 peptide-methionine (S)-S-oxide reductase MsrA [Armatimonadota bacterium]
MAIATFAAGCFWGVEEAFRTVPGVIRTTVGYTGGHTVNPTYPDVCSGNTGHAEAVRVEYVEAEITYSRLLAIFWQAHDPTQLNRQGPDHGSQYRSAIFVQDAEQRREALTSLEALANSGTLRRPIVTSVEDAGEFYPAEEYHQQYLVKHGRAACHI